MDLFSLFLPVSTLKNDYEFFFRVFEKIKAKRR
jgi:hypothetical protein